MHPSSALRNAKQNIGTHKTEPKRLFTHILVYRIHLPAHEYNEKNSIYDGGWMEPARPLFQNHSPPAVPSRRWLCLLGMWPTRRLPQIIFRNERHQHNTMYRWTSASLLATPDQCFIRGTDRKGSGLFFLFGIPIYWCVNYIGSFYGGN